MKNMVTDYRIQLIRRLSEAKILFLKDQIIKDFKKVKKLKFIIRNYIDLDPMPSIMMNDDKEREIQEDDGNIVDDSILDNDVPDEQLNLG